MLERVKQFGLNLQEQCREETLLYQAISGLHASINMHVAANYYEQDRGDLPFMNHTLYYHGLGKHPDRLKNMHFVYALVVRAVNRVHEQLLFNNYTTGLCEQNDQLTLIYMTNLLAKTISDCSDSFNEKEFFNNKHGEDFNQKLLLDEVQAKFYNISKIFDCIGCDKCRFNGKVQITGLGAAMKILFSTQRELDQKVNQLHKIEIIGLINLLSKLSESIEYYKQFIEMEEQQKAKIQVYRHLAAYLSIVFIFSLFKFLDFAEQKRIAGQSKKKDGAVDAKSAHLEEPSTNGGAPNGSGKSSKKRQKYYYKGKGKNRADE